MKKCYHIRLCHYPSFSNEGISKGFIDNGYDLKEFDFQQYRMKHGIKKLREHLIKEVTEFQPTLIFAQIQNSEALDIETWKALQSVAPTINFTFDVRDYEQTKWMYEVCPFISMTCFACQEDVAQCRYVNSQFGISKSELGGAMLLNSSCDMDFYHKVEPAPDKYPEIIFIGNNYEGSNLNFPKAKERQGIINALYEEFGDSFATFGLGQKGGYLNPEQERQAYSSARVTFTQNNYEKSGYQSDRFYRAAACECVVIPERYEGIDEKLAPQSWKDKYELIAGIKHYYVISKQLVEKRGKEISSYVRENHSYANRVKQLEEELSLQFF